MANGGRGRADCASGHAAAAVVGAVAPPEKQLLDLANARDREAFDRAIDVRITRIRRKIEPDPARPSVIRTVRGAGYLFSPAGEKA